MNVDPQDLPRKELADLAERTIHEHMAKGLRAEVHFKYTCANCGARCILAQPNTLYERGECNVCGHETVIEKGGFMLMYST